MKLKIAASALFVLIFSFIGNVRADITSGLVLYLPLNETSGTTASDSSGLGNNGALTGFSGDNSYWTNGWITNGLKFGVLASGAATTNYISIPNTPSLNFNTTNAVNTTSNLFTLAAWVKMPTAQTPGAAILTKGTGANEQYDLDLNASKFRFIVRNTGSGLFNLPANVVVPNNTWTHVVVTVDASSQTSQTARMYINGVSNVTATSTVMGTLRAGSNPVTVGARQSAATAYNLAITNSTVDEVRIYNRVLSPSDIFELYSFGGFGNTNGSLTITTQPRNVTNYVGDVTAFAVAPGGNAPFFYQWFSNSVAIANQTNSSLVLTNVQLSWSAAYSVQITNIIGSTNSDSAFLQVQSLPAADITNNLVGYWKFDDGAGSSSAADSSVNGNSGTLTGFNDPSSAWVTGITNGALNFNGDLTAGNLVAIPAVGTPGPAVLDFSANPAFTLAAWVNAPASTIQSNGAAIICRGAGSGGEQYALDLPTTGYRFYIRNSNNASFNLTTTIKPNGTWQHVVAVFDAINGIQNIYVNGVLANITVAPTSLSTNASTHEVSIGNRQSGATTPYNLPFTGAIDDTHIYSRALTSADVQALYLAGGVYPPDFAAQPQSALRYVGDDITFSPVVSGTLPITYQWLKNATNIPNATNLSLILTNLQLTNAGSYTLFVSNGYNTNLSSPAVLQVTNFILTNSLAGYWKLDDGSGSAAIDSSANGNNGSLSGSDYQWMVGRIGGDLNLNTLGSLNTYVSVPDAPSLNFDSSRQFSLTAWVRGSATQVSGAAIIAKGTGGGGEEYGMDVQAGVFRLFVHNAAGASVVLASPVAPNGSWQHVVATYDGSAAVMRIYVNGQLVASGAAPTSLFSNNHEVSIGNRQSASAAYNLPFAGMIDDVRIYTRPLNANDVQQLYSSAFPFLPVIYSFQPNNGSLLVGDNVAFSASADGDAPLSYQWLKDNVNIPDATNLTYTLNNVQFGDAGTYTFRVSNGASASSNIVITVQAVPAPDLAASLIAYWTFDETTGLSVADSSGNGNSISLFNFSGDDSQWAPGRIGGALHMNANGVVSNQFGATDNPLSLQNGDLFSFSFWAKLDSGPHGANPRFITPSSTHWVLWTPNRGVGFFTPTNSTEPSTNVWTHYVVVFDRVAGRYTLYVNGAREAANVGPYSKTDPTGLFWAIGHSESGTASTDSWTGFLDDMRVYNRLLNINDARALYYSAGGQPSLSITRNGSNVMIVWSAAATGFQLQSTDTLGASAVWSNTGTPSASADGLTQTISTNADTGAKFYRLQK